MTDRIFTDKNGNQALRIMGAGVSIPMVTVDDGLAVPDISSAIATPGNAVRDAIDAIVNPVSANAAMVTELTASTVYASSIAATLAVPVWIAPFACRITAAALYTNATPAITADDTNYWSVDLRRIRAGTAAVIATKTTQLTGGETIAIRTAWTFNGVAFSATNQLLQAGDAVDFAFNKVAAAVSLSSPSLFMVRYEPV